MSDFPPQEDLSAYDDQPMDYAIGSDAEAMKKIGQRSSLATKIMAGVTAVVVVGGGYWAYQQSVEHDGRHVPLDKIGELSEAERPAAFLALLKEQPAPDVKERILKNLGHYKVVEAVPAITDELQHAGVVRRGAAWALAEIGLPAAASSKAKLQQQLATTTDVDRAQVVWTLALLEDKSDETAEALISMFSEGRLQKLDRFDPRAVSKALGTARLSKPELAKHEKEGVRVLTAHALSEVASAEVVDPLANLLTTELAREKDAQSSEVIRAAAAGLGRTGDARAAKPLFAMLQSKPNMKNTVVDALKRSTGAPGIATLMKEAKDVNVKRDLVNLIAGTHDTRGADTLATLLADPDKDIKSTAALALAEMGDKRAANALFELAANKEDDTMMSNAIDAMRHISHPEMTGGLTALLKDTPYRKASILKALGATGDPGAARPIEAELDGDDVGSASIALAMLNHDGSFKKLMKVAPRPSKTDLTATNAAERSLPNEPLISKRKAAIVALGRFGRPEATGTLMTIVEDGKDDYELRGKAAASLGQVAEAQTMGEVLKKVQDPAMNETTRRYYVQAIWQKPWGELNAPLLDLMSSDAPGELRKAAALALGYAADPQNDARLISMLDSKDARRYAAFAIALGGGKDAVAKLLTVLGEDRDTREVLQLNVQNGENDWFNLLTAKMFESGAYWRRVRAAKQLKDGNGKASYGYLWSKIVDISRSGWTGTGGARSFFVREKLFEALKGKDADRSKLAAAMLGDIPERGLLLRARDEGGAAGEMARTILRGKDNK